jgi:3-methylcrotonyl-CoA carboxylase alpha subunit
VFAKILVANRGEIACRVMRTARRMGIATVAVYSDADVGAMHVAMADEAYRIGPPPARDSYLNIAAVIGAARRSGARAVHPGYGFLSENVDFAEACAAAGIVFIGPPPAAIRAMGSKSEAKTRMQRAGVPLVPGYHGEAQDSATLADAAARIGYPVLIKASAGGGGKGMRVVERVEDLAAAIAGAKREALSSFGDDRVLIERYLQKPRHIEIQVFVDAFGDVVSLFERDCSIQRRHQKIIEEAPAPGMTEAMRQAIGEAAAAAARAVGYVGAGTVEFIVEGGGFHFMEMNTRLQVEHPVTEMITGQDLVEWQFRVAAGEHLPRTQDELRINGHAIEVRIYAEDPSRNFLPSTGGLEHLRTPQETGEVRIDLGVRQGDRISADYDPMLAKLIVHGPDRATALRRLSAALDEFEVVGIQTNIAFLRTVVAQPTFAAGDFDTGFIARHGHVLAAPTGPPPPLAVAGAVASVLRERVTSARAPDDPFSPWAEADKWRANLEGAQTVWLRHGAETLAVRARSLPAGWRLEWSGSAHEVLLHHAEGARWTVQFDDRVRHVSVVRGCDRITVVVDGVPQIFDLLDPLLPPHAEAVGSGRVIAPIPGRIASVLVKPGDTVSRGQVLVVVEAMKMELSLTAAADGVVSAVNCGIGEMVEEGRDLVDFVGGAGDRPLDTA